MLTVNTSTRRQRQPRKVPKRKRPLWRRRTVLVLVSFTANTALFAISLLKEWRFLTQAFQFSSRSSSSALKRAQHGLLLGDTPLSSVLFWLWKEHNTPLNQQHRQKHSRQKLGRLFSLKSLHNSRNDKRDYNHNFNATGRNHSRNHDRIDMENFTYPAWDKSFEWMTLPSKDDNSTLGKNATVKRKTTQPIGHSLVSFPENRLREYYAWLRQQQQRRPELEWSSSSFEILANKTPHDYITVADLERILRHAPSSEWAARSNKLHSTGKAGATMRSRPVRGVEIEPYTSSVGQSASVDVKKKTSAQKKSSNVAFPQPSVLSDASVQWGATTSGSILGLIVGISMAPNLWLLGALLGGLYGYETGQRWLLLEINNDNDDDGDDDSNRISSNLGAAILIRCGRQLALAYWKMYDSMQTFWFMYKTGQLSYEYYQRYTELDQRFAIQQKVDAWNARFVQGKRAFDQWERDNEVGRKVLATLRTAWLVEERSKNRLHGRRQRSSKYRLIQLLFDASYTCGQVCASAWQRMTMGQSRLQELLRGAVSSSLSPSSSRVGSMLVAWIMVYVVGTLFTISPVISGIVAASVGYLWPSWVSELTQQANIFMQEARPRGRADPITTRLLPSTPTRTNATSGGINDVMHKVSHVLNDWFHFVREATAEPRASIKAATYVDKSRFHYFRSKDGKKRYYRVGVPWWTSSSQRKRKEGFNFPWQKS